MATTAEPQPGQDGAPQQAEQPRVRTEDSDQIFRVALDDESARERRNRELIELLNELRVALPGVQVLFAFLLILPFSGGWAKTTGLQRDVYFAAFLCTAAASGFLIAPSAYHRLNFRLHDKERLLLRSNTFTIIGTAFLALAVSLTTYVVADELFDVPAAVAVAVGTASFLAALWYIFPLALRWRVLKQQGLGSPDPQGRG